MRQPGRRIARHLHGNKTYLLQDEDGQIDEAHSISAGLDYPGIGPEHSWLKESGRVDYTAVTDDRGTGRVPTTLPRPKGSSRRSSPATPLRRLLKQAKAMDREPDHPRQPLCGRGDKDIFTVAEALGTEI